MSDESNPSADEDVTSLKPIRKITEGQEIFVDLEAFKDDMDEQTIEQEWGRSTGTTILPESTCKYNIIERIDRANRELDDDAPLSSTSSNSSDCSTADDASQNKKRLVHFSQTVHTAHYLSPTEGENEDHEDVETAGYWSAEEISATPEEEVDYSEEGQESACYNRQRVVARCQTPESADNWYDSEDGSSVDLSALTDSVDRLDLSPLNTDSPENTLRPCTPLITTPPYSHSKVGSCEQVSTGKRKSSKRNHESNKLNMHSRNWNNSSDESINHWNIPKARLNKWNRTAFKVNCWNLADSNLCSNLNERNQDKGNKVDDESKCQRRVCLSRQDQTKLPKYNGLRSEYGLSQQQLTERKRVKVERKKVRQQKRKDKEQEAEERRRANQIVFNNWLDKKRQQEVNVKSKRINKWNVAVKNPNSPQQRAFSAHVSGSKKILSPQANNSKLGLLRRILSASMTSPKEQMTYSIYLGLPVRRTSFKQL